MNTLLNWFGRRHTAERCVVPGVLALVLTSCGHGANDPEYVTRIPGTEKMAGAVGSMYVSPDECRMTFLTVDRETYVDFGLESIELATGRRVEHHLDRTLEPRRGESEQDVYLDIVGSQGGDAGWFDGRLFLPLLRGKGYLVVNGNETVMALGKLPDELAHSPLMLSDAPEWGTWRDTLNSRLDSNRRLHDGGQVGMYSAAWHGNRYSATVYWWSHESRSIFSGTPGQNAKIIKSISGGGLFLSKSISMLRVSPDEAYLAYVVWHRHRYVLSPFTRDDVHVIDLASGKDRVVCRFRLAGNLQWSPDGNRLYLTGNNGDETRGVYVIDVARAFE